MKEDEVWTDIELAIRMGMVYRRIMGLDNAANVGGTMVDPQEMKSLEDRLEKYSLEYARIFERKN